MVLDFFRSGSGGSLDKIEQQVQEMLADNETTFGLATDAAFGRVDPVEIGKELRKSDRQVNRGERSIRRELIVHSGVAGAADYPLMLVYMSIIKDIERVGDYSKNIWDLTVDGFELGGSSDEPIWAARFERTQNLISETAAVFAERDIERAKALLPQMDEWTGDFDLEISALIRQGSTAGDAVPRALLNRYLKRITAHLMNVMTAVVMPLDRLDYWDEDRADRLE
jgi:phosphate uptake regulator